jgi:UDP-3-O-[3-hydroxymyristoyl] N-acetylglucosamine deacetylase
MFAGAPEPQRVRSMVSEVALFGRGLHSGAWCGVRLRHSAGELVFEREGVSTRLAECRVVRADHGVQLELAAGVQVDLVEHLLAALGGLGIHEGLTVSVSGPELPLLDGGGLVWARALGALALAPRTPRLEVVRALDVSVGSARYSFRPAASPSLEVEIEFDNPAIGAQHARWEGDAGDFVQRIAPARTFGFVKDGDALRRAGRARFVDPRAVIVLDEHGATPALTPKPSPGEFARHKLLDLIGDLYLFGGPPRGHVHALRPGHAATRLAVREALRLGGLSGAPPLLDASLPGAEQ